MEKPQIKRFVTIYIQTVIIVYIAANATEVSCSVSCTLEMYTLCKNCWFSHPLASTFGMPLRHEPWRDKP